MGDYSVYNGVNTHKHTHTHTKPLLELLRQTILIIVIFRGSMADWLHCNTCFRQPGDGCIFFLTGCGHIFCGKCQDKGRYMPTLHISEGSYCIFMSSCLSMENELLIRCFFFFQSKSIDNFLISPQKHMLWGTSK